MVNRDSYVPLYHQLRELIMQEVESGALRPGDQIPTEAELGARHGISRMTVRMAITELVREGVLVRTRGKGTFVAKPAIQKRLSSLLSFTEEMTQRGASAGSRLLSFSRQEVGKKLAEHLELQPGDPVWEVRRLRMADGEPIAIQRVYLPVALCPTLSAEHVEGRSLYRLLSEHYGLVPARAQERYRPVLPVDAAEAALLGVSTGSPCFWVERTTYRADGRVMEFVQSILRGDRYTLEVDLLKPTSRDVQPGRSASGASDPALEATRL
ncbi:MAG: GntR family transcriptional regulator [Bacillota bacterium]